jgi:hypothetical protein
MSIVGGFWDVVEFEPADGLRGFVGAPGASKITVRESCQEVIERANHCGQVGRGIRV